MRIDDFGIKASLPFACSTVFTILATVLLSTSPAIAAPSCVSGALPSSHVFTRWDGDEQIGGGVIVDGPKTECTSKLGQFDTIKAVQYWETNDYRHQVYTRTDGRSLGSLNSHFVWRRGLGANPVIKKKSKGVCVNSKSNKRAVVGLKSGKCEVLLTIVANKNDVASSNKLCKTAGQLDSNNCGWFLTVGQRITAKLTLNFTK